MWRSIQFPVGQAIPETDRFREISLHEAAHAVIGHVNGQSVERIVVGSDRTGIPDFDGFSELGPRHDAHTYAERRTGLIRDISVHLAGPLASATVVDPKRALDGGRYDVKNIVLDLEGLRLINNLSALESVIRMSIATTRAELKYRWNYIERLAAELLRVRDMRGAAILPFLPAERYSHVITPLAARNVETRKAPAELPMQHRLAPLTEVATSNRTFNLVFSTGAKVRRRKWVGWDTVVPFDETLLVSKDAVDLSRMNAGAPVLDSHNLYSTAAQLAVVDRAWINGSEAWATVRFPSAGVDKAADRVFNLVAERIIKNVSVGYSIDQVRIVEAQNKGQVEQHIVERWTPYEVSFVTVPADAEAQVRSAEAQFPIAVRVAPEPMHEPPAVSYSAADIGLAGITVETVLLHELQKARK
ncbi:HK97 family phage prohead protease [Mesorhizobium sp. ASY16-5R]|uniref:HK97 family phage prohead protease n=1 Tax=Mesorhizobium sp. ASY16-5R TaxID=3445772 RepID=UPI003FA0327F